MINLVNFKGLEPLKQLFWSDLNYERNNRPLRRTDFNEKVRELLAEDPLLFASAPGEAFHIIYVRLAKKDLLLTEEREVINELLPSYPYALFIFSNYQQDSWHFVNVKTGDKQDAVNGQRRRLFRRISVLPPYTNLHTATERLKLLDLSTISERDMFGISPLAVQARHDEAFDVEAVTKAFFSQYRAIFQQAEKAITGISGDARRLFTQKLFNRLMFIVFLEKKGWLTLNGSTEYILALWKAHQRELSEDPARNFYNDRLKYLFFLGLSTPNDRNIIDARGGEGYLQTVIGNVPYLNGGLFEKDADDENLAIVVPDEALEPAINDLFYRFNFTVVESTPLDVEVAVDPEMLGRMFEELVTGRHESGSYYTPKPVVSFMGREALKGYLETACPHESSAAIAAFVDDQNPENLVDPESVLKVLQQVHICDPACGSGAYLLGMLHELLDLRAALFRSKGLDAVTAYERKLEIIQNNIYGVDLDPFAVNIARLRLWLSLIVDFEGEKPLPLPNLDYKIEVGDSLSAPDPSGGISVDLFRQQQIREFREKKALYLRAHGNAKQALKRDIDGLRQRINKWALSDRNYAGGFDWAVEFAEVFADGGFDIVLANPPYVRADAQFRHLDVEQERQGAIAEWRAFREALRKAKNFASLYKKWDLYVPFLERAYQILRNAGHMVFIIPDAYNIAEYAKKSHEFFINNSLVRRIDFCSDIPLFNAGVRNTILHFSKTKPTSHHMPLRFRRWGDAADDFDKNIEQVKSEPQISVGKALFRIDQQNIPHVDKGYIALEVICYISVGMVIHADERRAHLAFKTDDLISEFADDTHPKRFVEGKDLGKWAIHRVHYLEYGTERAPTLFRRPTFPELYEVPEKLISMDLSGDRTRVVYDNAQTYHNHSAWSFVLWHDLAGVRNKSIAKKAKYRTQHPSGNREKREAISRQFHIKYLLAIMNSSFASEWLIPRRRHKMRFYPDDWKNFPIKQIPLSAQLKFVSLVDNIILEINTNGYPLPLDSKTKIEAWEREIDEMVASLYSSEIQSV